jgi:hypothetical protein
LVEVGTGRKVVEVVDVATVAAARARGEGGTVEVVGRARRGAAAAKAVEGWAPGGREKAVAAARAQSWAAAATAAEGGARAGMVKAVAVG